MMTCFSHFSAGVMKRGVDGERCETGMGGHGSQRQTKAGREGFFGHLGHYLIRDACETKNCGLFRIKLLHVVCTANSVDCL